MLHSQRRSTFSRVSPELPARARHFGSGPLVCPSFCRAVIISGLGAAPPPRQNRARSGRAAGKKTSLACLLLRLYVRKDAVDVARCLLR